MKGEGKRCRVGACSFGVGSVSVGLQSVFPLRNAGALSTPVPSLLCPQGPLALKFVGSVLCHPYHPQVTHPGEQTGRSHSQPSHSSGIPNSKAALVGDVCLQPLRVGFSTSFISCLSPLTTWISASHCPILLFFIAPLSTGFHPDALAVAIWIPDVARPCSQTFSLKKIIVELINTIFFEFVLVFKPFIFSYPIVMFFSIKMAEF